MKNLNLFEEHFGPEKTRRIQDYAIKYQRFGGLIFDIECIAPAYVVVSFQNTESRFSVSEIEDRILDILSAEIGERQILVVDKTNFSDADKYQVGIHNRYVYRFAEPFTAFQITDSRNTASPMSEDQPYLSCKYAFGGYQATDPSTINEVNNLNKNLEIRAAIWLNSKNHADTLASYASEYAENSNVEAA